VNFGVLRKYQYLNDVRRTVRLTLEKINKQKNKKKGKGTEEIKFGKLQIFIGKEYAPW